MDKGERIGWSTHLLTHSAIHRFTDYTDSYDDIRY